MKRLFLFIPIAFLFFVNSCADLGVPQLRDAVVATAIQETQRAATRAAAPTPTPNPNIPYIVNWLNGDLSTVSPLGRAMDAEYHVMNVSFPSAENGLGLIFRVDVGCICINGEDCCIPERTFVLILEAMYRNRSTALAQVPTGLSEVMVVCGNRQTKAQIGAITVSWQNVDAFLRDQINGDQLGVRVTRTTAP
jgi:hypothetical protein